MRMIVSYAKKGCALVFARISSWFYVEGITNLENKLVQKKPRRFEKHTSRDTKIFDFKRSLHSARVKETFLKGERNLLVSVPSMLSQAEHTSYEAYAFYVLCEA